jgi:hypothetical protein
MMVLDTHVITEEKNDDWVDPVDYWFATGEGWEDIPLDQQRQIEADIRGSIVEAWLMEHPGHPSQKVHNPHRGGGVAPARAQSPGSRPRSRPHRPGGHGAFGREVAGWQTEARKGGSVRIFGTAIEKHLAEGQITHEFMETGGGTTVVGLIEIDGRKHYTKPDDGFCDNSVDVDGLPSADRVDSDGRAVIPVDTAPERELASYYVDHALGGLVNAPAVVIRQGGIAEGETFQRYAGSEFMADSTNRWAVVQNAEERMPAGASATIVDRFSDLPVSDQRRIAMFDSLIGNSDRHSGNWYAYTDAGGTDRVIPIDHSLSFPRRQPDWGNFDSMQTSHKLRASDVKALKTIRTQRAKVRRDLMAILNDTEAVDGFFHRVDFMLRKGRTIDVYDLNALGAAGVIPNSGGTRFTSPRDSWARLSELP